MGISLEQIKEVAQLARLELSEEELERYQEQLAKVLDYMRQLEKIDTSAVEPTAQVTSLENVWRLDKVEPWPQEEAEAARGAAVLDDDNQIQVKKVL
ncbi:Asp-tRNA(Asn)/Glu-tRNA(Gln) amidotransferase subunit GatC [Candidatus Parcubacteria bacterium]|nr:MAG: Asp-tRNA(Asn)/Glu-tRNA(Gln) amidotransferase subunit GatC [Candidatus Parcubacteria bacterium]